jgi:hypothetical protein
MAHPVNEYQRLQLTLQVMRLYSEGGQHE